MRFLRVVGFWLLGTSVAFAGNWKEEQTKTESPVLAQAAAASPAQAAPAAQVEPKPAASAAVTAPAAEPSEGNGYVVKEGDTLWDLADSYYKNPFDWRKIWDANKGQIENPDLIYPDQKFVIPGSKEVSAAAPAKSGPSSAEKPQPASEPAKTEEAAAPEAEPAEEAEAEPEAAPEEAPPPMVVKKTPKTRDAYKTGSFLTQEKWEGSGKIVGDKERKVLLSQNDVVYLNLGAADGVKAKMRGTIYRRGRMVRDPHTGEKMGYAINRLGVLEVTQEVTDHSATAVIVVSEDPVRVGDFFSLDE